MNTVFRPLYYWQSEALKQTMAPIAALRILSSAAISPAEMKGGWSGEMGHMQFMPTNFRRHAVDQNDDGRRDIWGDDPADALGSTANYLHALGWKAGAGWGVEVDLPDGFDCALVGEYDPRIVAF